MSKLAQHGIVLIVTACLVLGCGSSQEKGVNKDLDRPKSTEQKKGQPKPAGP